MSSFGNPVSQRIKLEDVPSSPFTLGEAMCPGISHSDSAVEDVDSLVPGGLGIIHFTSRSESMKFSKMVVCAA